MSCVLLYLVKFFPFAGISFGLPQLENTVKKRVFLWYFSPYLFSTFHLFSSCCETVVLLAAGSFLFVFKKHTSHPDLCVMEDHKESSLPHQTLSPRPVTMPSTNHLLMCTLDKSPHFSVPPLLTCKAVSDILS